MADQPNEYLRARQEAATLLRLNSKRLSTADALRCDVVSALRLAIDAEHQHLLDGDRADLSRLVAAVEKLATLLPEQELPQREPDPREALREIFMRMSERRAAGRADAIAMLKAEVDRLRAENERLRLGANGSNTTPAVITPPTSDIVPPGERAELNMSPPHYPDDPKPKRSPVIDGTVVAAYDYDRNRSWRDYVEPTGEIRSTPRRPGRYWGPV